MSFEKSPAQPMASDGSDSTGDSPDSDPISFEALDEFLDGLEEQIRTDFGVISSRTEMRKVKREIAREMGIGEKYSPNIFVATNEDLKEGTDERRTAHAAVERSYQRLVDAGEVQEAPELEESESVFAEVNRELVGDPLHRTE